MRRGSGIPLDTVPHGWDTLPRGGTHFFTPRGGGSLQFALSLYLSLRPLLLSSHSSPHTPPHPLHLLAIQCHSADALWHLQVVSPNTRLSSICLVWKGIGKALESIVERMEFLWSAKNPQESFPGKSFQGNFPGKFSQQNFSREIPRENLTRKCHPGFPRKHPANWENNLAGCFVLMKLGFWPGK